MSKIENGFKFSCGYCSKGFFTDAELKIHEKYKHKTSALEKNDNINSSDVSDEEEAIPRYKQQYQKNTSNILNNAASSQAPRYSSVTGGKSVIGKFDDPTLQKNGLKKVYLCGCSHKVFENSELLTLHISKLHNCFPPEGTLYGVCRDQIIRQFRPQQQKMPSVHHLIERRDFICGCRLSFSRLPSLQHHIRTAHGSIVPVGTFGLPKYLYKTKQNNGTNQPELSDSKTISQKDGPQCSVCLQPSSCNWVCSQCGWRICQVCGESEDAMREHYKLGHKTFELERSD